jgi:nucleoside-diphosphate-sugar epimerase
MLDDQPPSRGFSAYSTSKVAGEQVLDLHRTTTAMAICLYRPPSVQGPDRHVSQMISRVARSRFASVAGVGDRPSPQALIDNVGSAIAFLASCPQLPPAVVHHPSESLTTGDVMTLLSAGQEPRHIPTALAIAVIKAGKLAGRAMPSISANVRRLEIVWLGQRQAPSWLTAAGWTPVAGRDAWAQLGRDLASAAANPSSAAVHTGA